MKDACGDILAVFIFQSNLCEGVSDVKNNETFLPIQTLSESDDNIFTVSSVCHWFVAQDFSQLYFFINFINFVSNVGPYEFQNAEKCGWNDRIQLFKKQKQKNYCTIDIFTEFGSFWINNY